MPGLTFQEHLAEAREHPAYWSYRSMLEFIDLLVAEMGSQGVSAAELARRMGTSRAWVSRVLRGENNLTVASMGKLAFALGMRVTTELAPLEEGADRETRAAALNRQAEGLSIPERKAHAADG
jgi:transcriptional regulator with XRE-family HTH domain